MPRKSSFKNNLTKTLLAFFIAFFLFWPIKFIQAIPLAPVLSGAEGALGAASVFPVMTTPSPWSKIFEFIKEQIKEVAALAWKRTQVYFGTRLAHDAAVYLASGGRGQSSFIWNWDEVKELADGAAGEFLDDLSQTYFGKSACVPGDLGVQVQIDLNARALIGEMMDVATAGIPNVCEAICSRTAPGAETTSRTVTGAGGDVASLFGPGMDASKVNKNLAEYDKAVDDLINSILDSEEEMSRAIGKYIFEQVGYTLHGDEKTSSLKGVFKKGLADYNDANCNDWTSLDMKEFYSYLDTGVSTKAAPIWLEDSQGVCGGDSIQLDGHGPRFANLIKNILNDAEVTEISTVSEIFEKQNIAYFNYAFDEFWSKQNLIDSLGLMYLLVGSEYDPATDKLVGFKDDSIVDLADFFTLTYDLFSVLKSAPAATVVEIDDLLNMLGVSGAELEIISKVQAHILKGLSHDEGIFESSKRTYKDVILDDLIAWVLNDWGEEIIQQAQDVAALQEEIKKTHGADLDELIKAYQNFSQCMEACERGQIAEPHGACTLSEITKQEGFMGVTGIEGGVTGTVDFGPFGSITDSWQEGTAIGKGRDEHAQEMKEGARLTVADLQDLSTIGDPANNPLGQALQIMEKSQRQSEEAKERELAESQRAFASDKDLVSGTIKMPGSQVEGRLTGALADIRAANNEYTGSILAQMWGVFFNTLIKEFQEKLFGQGLQPKVYSGPFDPTTRRAYGEGIEAAKEQFSKFANPNITAGGEMNSQILTRLTSGCKEQPDNQQRFDECIIDNHFKDAIEQQMTLDQAVKKNLVRGVFGFHKNGNQPIVGQGIPYNSMIVLRKYRIIPSSWEAAAIWVRDVVAKDQGSKDITIDVVMAGYKKKDSPYFGLVNPGWVLKLPMFQCARQGAGEQIVSQSPMPYDSYFSEEGDFTVNISRMDDYCGDAKSCIREKNDGTGCEANSYGYCAVERDFWRFPSEQCKDQALYKTCQTYIDPNNQSAAYLDQTLNLDECDSQSDGCQGYLRDYSWSRLTGGVSPRIDGLSDNPFTFAPDRFAEGFDELGDYGIAYQGTASGGTKTTVENQFQPVQGSVEAATDSTLTIDPNDQELIINFWIGAEVATKSGVNDTTGQIIGNTETILTVKSWSNGIPSVNESYSISFIWKEDQWKNAAVSLNTGHIAGAYGIIADNTSEVITVDSWIDVPPIPVQIYQVGPDGKDQGTVSSADVDFLTDENKNWYIDEWKWATVETTNDADAVTTGTVLSNTNNQLKVGFWDFGNPKVGAFYTVTIAQDSGNATSTGPDWIRDDNKHWTSDKWKGAVIETADYTFHGTVKSNNENTLYVEWDDYPQPSQGDRYQIYFGQDPSLKPENLILNPIGLVDDVPSLWQCTNNSTGQFCFYERIAGRKEGCKLQSGAYCDPWKQVSLTKCEVRVEGKIFGECYFAPPDEVSCLLGSKVCDGISDDADPPGAVEELIRNAKTVLGAASVNPIKLAEPDSAQIYWCGLPGGAGCFVGQEEIDELKDMAGDPPKMISNPVGAVPSLYHTTSKAGIQCVVGAWKYESDEYTFYAVPADINDTIPLTCSLYRQTQDTAPIGSKRVYLTGTAQECSLNQAGCQEYFGVEFPSNEYVIDDQDDATIDKHFLKADHKKEFIINLLDKAKDYYENLEEEFDYTEIPLIDIIPDFLDGAVFENEPQIVRKPLNYQRQYCTEKDIDCRKYYPASGAEALAGVLDPRKDLCPAQCVGYAHYKEPTSQIENRLGTYIVIDDKGNITAEPIAGTINRYFIADREEQCPPQFAGCEYFMRKTNVEAIDLYLTDLRLCVNTQYYPDDRAVYTIIESAAKGATNPVNIELVKSTYNGTIFYKINGEQVIVSATDLACGPDCGQLYETGYNAPCIAINPESQGSNPDLWSCTDNFNEIKSALERCLTVKTLDDGTKQVVSNLAKAECREYIYFPDCTDPQNCGAERYPLSYDLPIRVSNSCRAFKRGGAKSPFIYNIDPDSEVLEGKQCDESSVSCREYLGAGSSITGKLSWVDFEDVAKWGMRDENGNIIDEPSPPNSIQPALGPNVNGVNEALVFKTADVPNGYVYNILQEPLDPDSEEVFRDETGTVKSFKLSLWAQADKGTVIEIKLKDKGGNDIADFQVDDVDHKPVFYKTLNSKWHYIVFNQVSELDFVPHYLYVKSDKDFSLDSIVLEDFASIFRKQRDLAFILKRCSAGPKIGNQCIDNSDCDGQACNAVKDSIAAHIDKDCNTNFDVDGTPKYDPAQPFPYQLSCQAYTTDNNQSISFKANTVSLCKDEVVGCQALINTFNTQNPSADTYWPRGKDTEGKDPSGYDDYFVPKDSIEYVVANPSNQCDQIGCTLLGKEIKDQAGKVTGFEEEYLIDLPMQYQDLNQPIACLIKEQSCDLYKTKETGMPKRFKSPEPFACEWTSPSAGYSTDWYKSVDEKGKIESCDSWYEQLDPAIDLEIKRPKGFCIEQYTDRPVLDPEDELTAWCDPDDKRSLSQIEIGEGGSQHTNGANTCLDFIDDPEINEDGAGGIDDDLISGINDGIIELNVQCAQAVAQCPVDQSQCTWFKDPLKSGLDKNYFQIHPDQQDVKGCGQAVNDDLGCVLFNDTEEGGPLIYSAEKSWNKASLDTNCNPEDCYGEDGELLPVDQWPNPNYCRTDYEKCDANVLMRVKRDRACGEWLSCKSAMTTADEKDTVCLDVKPCNVRSADGECVNFVGDAKESFTNKEIAESKELFSRAGRLSGYSNMGYEWLRCKGEYVPPDKQGDICVSSKECVDFDHIFKKGTDGKCPLSGSTCDSVNKIKQDDCKNNKCITENSFKGKSCQTVLDCYTDSELCTDYQGCAPIYQCHPWAEDVIKVGFKSLDHINQIGQHAEVVNGDFENVVFDVAGVASKGEVIKETYPVGWEYTDCDINKCQVTKRYNSTERAIRSIDVWRGKYSFLISGNAGKVFSVEQIIENVIPDSIYTASGWLKVIAGQGGYYSGIEIDELNGNGGDIGNYNCGDDNRSPGNPHCLITSGTEKSGWEYFVKKIATQPETRQLRVRLANNGNSTAIFDDVQVRAHLEALPGEYIAPSCRLYPGENSLNCDALDNNNNLIRGWRGYCVEPDPRWNSSNPRWTNQCVQWWPIDVISGETNVLGTIDETGYLNAPTPLHYCLETMDKSPGMPLPRLICVAKNDISGLGGEVYKYEACKIVALASDPKPKFYGLGEGNWRLGVDANEFGDVSDQGGYKVRMILGGEDDPHDVYDMAEKVHTSGLCVLKPGNRFIGNGSSPDCLNGCFQNQDLAGWGNLDKNRGIKTFWQTENNQHTYGCTWSANGTDWVECAQDLDQYYHKTAYFVYTNLDGNDGPGGGDEQKSGCQPADDGNGDRIYGLITTYEHKNAYPEEYIYPIVDRQNTLNTTWYKTIAPNKDLDAQGLIDLAEALTDDNHINANPNHNYYTFDNFELITRGRLNSETFIQRKGSVVEKTIGESGFGDFTEITPRLGRPEQCRIMAQTIDVSGHNKAWFNTVQTGAPSLDPPLGYDRTNYMCIPFGSAPYIRTPNDIMIEPYDKETFKTMSPVQAPLELYHPENPENKDVGLMCKENYRGQGFYACGGLCNICVGGDRDGSFCMSDEECPGKGICVSPGGVCAAKDGEQWKKIDSSCSNHTQCDQSETWICKGEGDYEGDPCSKGLEAEICYDQCEDQNGNCYKPLNPEECIGTPKCNPGKSCAPKVDYSCRKRDNLEEPFDPNDLKMYIQQEPGISAKPESGLRRLQNIFAKVFKVWEWIKVEDEDLKKNAGIDTGYYREMQDEDLDELVDPTGATTWSKEKDIANLVTTCREVYERNPADCSNGFPGCKFSECVPDSLFSLGDHPNDTRDYDYCRQFSGVKCVKTVGCLITHQIPGSAPPAPISNYPCIPYQNQYPDITPIKIDTKETDQVVLYEDDRNVNLEFKITANHQEQKPIVMVLIDWDDNTKTALSGIAWDDKPERSFTHTYAFYPAGSGGAPLGCREYIQNDPKSYECRFRPRIKVVDNWGWCNGQKLRYNDRHIAKEGGEDPADEFQPIILSDPKLQIEQGEGLSWGYYGADCFIQEYMGRCDTGPYIGNKCIDDSNCGGYTCADPSATADSRYGMQSWDYFGGYVQALPSSKTRESDEEPEIYLSFYDINGQVQLYHAELSKPILAKLECKDDYSLTNCFVMDDAANLPQLSDLGELNSRARTECIGRQSCAIWQESRFVNAVGPWTYTLTVSDDAQPQFHTREFVHSFPVIANEPLPVIKLWIDGQLFDGHGTLDTATDYTMKLSCSSEDGDNLKYCRLTDFDSNISISCIADLTCTVLASNCEKTVPNCHFTQTGKWEFYLQAGDSGGHKKSDYKDIDVVSP